MNRQVPDRFSQAEYDATFPSSNGGHGGGGGSRKVGGKHGRPETPFQTKDSTLLMTSEENLAEGKLPPQRGQKLADSITSWRLNGHPNDVAYGVKLCHNSNCPAAVAHNLQKIDEFISKTSLRPYVDICGFKFALIATTESGTEWKMDPEFNHLHMPSPTQLLSVTLKVLSGSQADKKFQNVIILAVKTSGKSFVCYDESSD
jgi:hypothetical protein